MPRRKQQEPLRHRGASDQAVIEAYEAGTPTKDILSELHISTETLARVRREHGLSRRRSVAEPAPIEQHFRGVRIAAAVAAPALTEELARLNIGTGFATPMIPVPDGRPEQTWEIAYTVIHAERFKGSSIEDAVRRFREQNGSEVEIRLVRRVEP